MGNVMKSPSLMVVTCAVIAACANKNDLVVWKMEEVSPDKQWQASADTVQNGGFGSASIDTTVYLKKTSDPNDPKEVLVFHCGGPVPHPYVLDNAANRGGTIDLHMTWITPGHLNVTYSGHPDLAFQAIRYEGIEITAQNLPGDGTPAQSSTN
jgi:hypothetical protein